MSELFSAQPSEKRYTLGHADLNERPVIYLDVDGTILTDRGVRDVERFLEWARAQCEVRWLTFWCARGYMDDEGDAILAQRLNVPIELVAGIRNPMPWNTQNKTTGINWAEHIAGRPWVWIEDECLKDERAVLEQYDATAHWLHCNCFEDQYALRKAWNHAEMMFRQKCGTYLQPQGNE